MAVRKGRTSSKKAAKKKWRVNSKEGRKLTKLLKEGTIAAGITPGPLCEEYPEFAVFERESFGAGLRRLKAKLGVNARVSGGEDDEEEEDEDGGDDAVSLGSSDTPVKTIVVPSSAAKSVANIMSIAGGFAPPPPMHMTGEQTEWSLPHIKTMVVDNDDRRHQVVVVLLPGGFVGEEDSGGAWVSLESGNMLTVSAPWPKAMEDGAFLTLIREGDERVTTQMWNALQKELGDGAPNYKDFQDDRDDYFRYVRRAFRSHLREMKRANGGEDKELRGFCRIKMDVACPEEITSQNWRYLGFKSGARMIYVDIPEFRVEDKAEKKKKVRKAIEFTQKETALTGIPTYSD